MAETTTILMVTACVLKRPGVVVPVSVEEEAVLLTSPAGKVVRPRKEPTTELEFQVCKKKTPTV